MGYLYKVKLHEDAAMELYLKLVHELPKQKFNDQRHFKNWLALITKNHCISKLRKVKIEKQIINNTNDLIEYVENDEEQRYNSINPNDLEWLFQGLSREQKQCIKLFFLKTYKITSAIIEELHNEGIPEAVLNKLKPILNREFHGAGFLYDEVKILLEGIDQTGEYIHRIINSAFLSDELSYKEICETTGYSYNEVKSHIQTGRIKLKRKFKTLNKKKNV